MSIRVSYVVLFIAIFHTTFVRADIFRWDNGEVIPGTEGISPRPGVQLDHRELSYANLHSRDLTDSNFSFSNLSFSNLANARMYGSTLTNANLTGAVVTGTTFGGTTSRGFTKEQLYSTQSYQEKNLRGIGLGENDLSGWVFAGQDLANADLGYSTLTNANLTGAVVTGTDFGPSFGFTKEQLYSTQSYQKKNLRGIVLTFNDLSGWDFVGQNLANADLGYSTLTNANQTGANLKNASLRKSIGSFAVSADTVYNQWTIFSGFVDPVSKGLTFMPSALGDLDGDVGLTVSDVELLGKRLLNPDFMSWQFAMFDLNSDSTLDKNDLRTWVVDLKKTWFGDANVDGQFNSSDLVQVFQAGQYEDDLSFNSTWSTGDWNADGDFTTSDLVVAFQDGGYEAGPRAGNAAVPEPASWIMLILGWLSLGILRRRKLASAGGTSGETRRFGFRAHSRVRRAVRGEEFEPRYCLSAVAFAAHDISVLGANSVYAADLDGDGDVDMLSASVDYPNSKIAWYENTDGQGTFDEQHVITTADGIQRSEVYAADLDGDGDLDILAVLSGKSDGKVAWYENTDGQSTFGDQRFITTSSVNGGTSVYAADLDGDGDLDVLRFHYGHIAWYKNTDGHGMFGEERVITTEVAAWQKQSVYAADVDGNGDVDVLSGSYWYENTDGNGTFGDERDIAGTAAGPQFVYAADVDGDGDLNVLSASFGDNKTAWYENTDGKGTFSDQRVITTTGAFSVYAADVDGDGDVDVLSAVGSTVAWYENTDGKGTFGNQRVITAGADARSVYAADVDGDGDVDVLSASFDDGRIAWYEQRLVGDSNGDGVFSPSDLVLVFQAGKYEDGLARNATFAEGDWNGDQEIDSEDLVLAFQFGHYQPAARAGRTDIAAAVDRLFANPDATRLSRSSRVFVS